MRDGQSALVNGRILSMVVARDVSGLHDDGSEDVGGVFPDGQAGAAFQSGC